MVWRGQLKHIPFTSNCVCALENLLLSQATNAHVGHVLSPCLVTGSKYGLISHVQIEKSNEQNLQKIVAQYKDLQLLQFVYVIRYPSQLICTQVQLHHVHPASSIWKQCQHHTKTLVKIALDLVVALNKVVRHS